MPINGTRVALGTGEKDSAVALQSVLNDGGYPGRTRPPPAAKRSFGEELRNHGQQLVHHQQYGEATPALPASGVREIQTVARSK